MAHTAVIIPIRATPLSSLNKFLKSKNVPKVKRNNKWDNKTGAIYLSYWKSVQNDICFLKRNIGVYNSVV